MAYKTSIKPYSGSLTESPEEAQFSVDALIEVREHLILVNKLIESQFTHPDGLSCTPDYSLRVRYSPPTSDEERQWYARERIFMKHTTTQHKRYDNLKKLMWKEGGMRILQSLLEENRRSIAKRIWTLEGKDGKCGSERDRVDVQRLRKSFVASEMEGRVVTVL